MAKTEYFCRLFLWQIQDLEYNFIAWLPKAPQMKFHNQTTWFLSVFHIIQNSKEAFFLKWKSTSRCWSFHWSPTASKPPWLYYTAILNIAGLWCLFSVAPFGIIWDCVGDALSSTRPSSWDFLNINSNNILHSQTVFHFFFDTLRNTAVWWNIM